MLDSDLVRMANQIAMFFAGFPDDEAIEGVRDHIMKFWTPAMRQQLQRLLASGGLKDAELHSLAVRATSLLT